MDERAQGKQVFHSRRRDPLQASGGFLKSDSVDSGTCLSTIKEVLDKHNYLIDPHTAVAYKVAERLHGENPVLIASTAHWAKFGENVYRALHNITPGQPLPESVVNLADAL